MRKILILLFLAANCLFAQKDSINTIVKFHPLAAINPDRPSITGTIEFLHNDILGIELGYGRRYTNGTWLRDGDKTLDTMTVDFSGSTILFEVTLYDPYKQTQTLDTNTNSYVTISETRDYMGIAYRYIDDLYNTSRRYYPGSAPRDTLSSDDFINDCYAIKRNVHVLVYKWGSVDKYRLFSTEFYFEAGIRYTNRVNINRESDPDNDLFDDYGTGIFFESPYKGFLPTLNFGLKVNYQLFD